jgi:hypothetical protein
MSDEEIYLVLNALIQSMIVLEVLIDNKNDQGGYYFADYYSKCLENVNTAVDIVKKAIENKEVENFERKERDY